MEWVSLKGCYLLKQNKRYTLGLIFYDPSGVIRIKCEI